MGQEIRDVWDAANTIEIVGLVLAYLGVGRIDQLPRFVPILGLVLLSAGIVIRLTAIQKLGAFFTSVVTIRENHQIIRTGLYRYIRHPGYTGALIAHAGLGLAFGSIVSITLSTVPFIAAVLYRMRVEEEALKNRFGEEYLNYAANTYRLFPLVY